MAKGKKILGLPIGPQQPSLAKRLVKLVFDRSVERPMPIGTSLVHASRDVGRITSAAISPRTGLVVALGYLPREVAESAKTVTVPPDFGGHTAAIAGFAG